MGITKWYEINCDKCGFGEYFPMGKSIIEQARNTGWILSKHGHFCSEKCLNEFKTLYKNELRGETEANILDSI